MFGRAEKRLEQRWEKRVQGPRFPPLVASASRVIEGRSREDVWRFVRPAESAVLCLPEVIKAFTVPDTGPGPGEQQVYIAVHDGHEYAILSTVIAVQEALYAEITSYQPGVPARSRYDLIDVVGGTRLRLSMWADPLPTLAVDRAATEAQMQRQAETYVLNVKAILEAPGSAGRS